MPEETIVVINGPRNPALEAVCNDFAGRLTWTWTPVAGKRNAVRIGFELASGDVIVLVDSDTLWTNATLAELLKPFADPCVGGVTTRQRILAHDRNLLTRWADWLENSRALYAMPAQSVLGQVGCLPGRTIAFRREILVRSMPAFLGERFLGVFLEISDDRTLTNYTLMQGYRTVLQSTSLVYTDAPTRLGKLIRQQYRWARGSQYNTLRMLPWMLRHTPVVAVLFITDLYGVFTPQAPFVMSEVDQLAAATGKTPNSVTFFTGWDQPFRADPIINAWRRELLPIVSWESRPHLTPMDPGSDNAVDAKYQLSSIIAGDFDAYIDKWAAAAKELGLPFGLRFDHEMNGFWYPWSEQANGNQAGEFVRAWRHVHDRFTAIGATNIIWIWSPNVIGALKDVSLPDLYPGGDYVDWLGLGGYYRKPIPHKPATFTNTFGESLAALRAVDDKPIMLTEIGCTETGGNKPAWIESLFEALSEQPDIIGFSWFNQTVTAIPLGQELPVTNDWRIDSSPQALAAFRAGIADPRYGSGKPAR